MSAPLAMNTKDGTCWTRRTVTSGGIALYAPESVKTCPDFVIATEAELAEHGIVGSADALPMPVSPEPQPRTLLDLARNALNARMAKDDLRLVLENVIGYAAGLEAERHSTNESLSEAAEQLRVNRDRITELEARLAEREQPADTYPPALPWARLMDAEDLADFLDELAASAITHASAEVALSEVESTCGRWRVIAEAQHAHNTAPGPNAEAPTTETQALRAEDTADLLTLAPAQHVTAELDPTGDTILLELTATREQWSAWQTALKVDLARTTNRGGFTTSHATWRGIHVVISRWHAAEDGDE